MIIPYVFKLVLELKNEEGNVLDWLSQVDSKILGNVEELAYIGMPNRMITNFYSCQVPQRAIKSISISGSQ